MATLRLFANLRETAGTSVVEIDGATVGMVLDRAVEAYGETFAAGLETAQVWVNGDQADRSTPVGDSDEIAVIPPVSGGAVASGTETDTLAPLLVVGLFGTLVVANLASPEAFVVAIIGAAVAWLWDLRDVYTARGRTVRMIPAMLAVAAAGNGAYRWGIAGLAGGIAVGVAVVLAWAVLDRSQRTIDSVAASLLAGLTGAVGVGAGVIVALRSPAETGTLLAVTASGAAAAWWAQRPEGQRRAVDPNVAALVVSLLAGAVAGYLTDTIDIVNAILAGALTGGGLIAGRTVGATIRLGRVYHTVRAPGLLTAFDGPMMGAAVFWLAIWLLT